MSWSLFTLAPPTPAACFGPFIPPSNVNIHLVVAVSRMSTEERGAVAFQSPPSFIIWGRGQGTCRQSSTAQPPVRPSALTFIPRPKVTQQVPPILSIPSIAVLIHRLAGCQEYKPPPSRSNTPLRSLPLFLPPLLLLLCYCNPAEHCCYPYVLKPK